jgi:hypothetical protein
MSDHEHYIRINNDLCSDFSESDIDDEIDNTDDIIIKTDSCNYPLKYNWVLYDHIKSDSESYEFNTRKICEFNNIIKFWQIFNNYPMPSQLFSNNNFKPTLDNKEISSISVFKDGIIPKWEDPVNKLGAEISKRKFNKKNPLEELDEDWINMLMNCISSSVDNGITGIRVVDSSAVKKNEHTGISDFKLLYRIELWFDNCSNRQLLEDKFKTILNIDDPRFIYYKEHNI